MKLVLSSVFEADFAELVGYFHENAGTTVSRRFEDEVCRLTKLLQKHPELDRARRDLKPDGLRSFVIPDFRNYLLFYQIKGDDLILLRAKFGGMDLPGLFRDWKTFLPNGLGFRFQRKKGVAFALVRRTIASTPRCFRKGNSTRKSM